MSCNDIQTRLHDYIEGALSESQRHRMDDHLKACAGCRQELFDIKATVALTQDLDEVDPPPFLTTRIMAEIRSTTQKRSWLKRLFWTPVPIPSGAMAGIMILFTVITIYTFWMPDKHTQPPPLASGDTAPQLPEDLSRPDLTQGPDNILANHAMTDTLFEPSPDLQFTLGVQAIAPNAKTVLRRLLDRDGRILSIVSDQGEYRITAYISTDNKQDLIQFLKGIDQGAEIIESLTPKANALVSIVFLRQPDKP